MRKTVNIIAIKLLTYFIIGVMGMLIVNNIAFTHVHQLDDGTIVKHAHPYNKTNESSPYKTHSHSNADLKFFQSLNILFFVAIFAFELIPFAKKENVIFTLGVKLEWGHHTLHQGRSPPFFS